MVAVDNISASQFYHGTTAKLSVGDMITTGHESNFGFPKEKHTYMTSSMEGAKGWANRVVEDWAAEGEHKEPHTYSVEPTGKVLQDPKATSTDFRSRHPLRITGEV